jgi:hypothetical protein
VTRLHGLTFFGGANPAKRPRPDPRPAVLNRKRRARQAELIRRWKPWERSTGPRTEEGKARVARNAFKGGARSSLRRVAEILRQLATQAPS